MRNYETPVADVVIFGAEEFVCASSVGKVTGGDGPVDLPDDEWPE